MFNPTNILKLFYFSSKFCSIRISENTVSLQTMKIKNENSVLQLVSHLIASDPVPTSCSIPDIPVRKRFAFSLAAERNLFSFFFLLPLSPKYVSCLHTFLSSSCRVAATGTTDSHWTAGREYVVLSESSVNCVIYL